MTSHRNPNALYAYYYGLWSSKKIKKKAPFSGIRPHADTKGPPLYYFEISMMSDKP